jgi:uncharacterized protein (TIGR02996 family)
MSEDEPFLRAIHAAPEDSTLRLVYADWLEERGDPRAEYLRLDARLAALPVGHAAAPGVRRRMVELRSHLPAPWLALLGDYRASSSDDRLTRAEQAAEALGRPVRYIDDEGYERDIVAAAMHHLTGAVGYVECRSQQRGQFLDINYHLRLRDDRGREAAWEVETYNPFFGCNVGFLEWYGDVVLVIYEEKHDTWICRFGVDAPAAFKVIEDDWVLDGRQLGYRGYQETMVRRLTIPGLDWLTPLTAEEAAEWGLLPAKYP